MIARYLATVRNNSFIPHEPTGKQAYFLLHDHIPEILYGGSAGGGKTDALLMAGLQYVEEPNYAALILRRTYKELALPGAIMDRAYNWLMPTKAKWSDDEKTWIFPSGATLTFGYLEGPRDHYRYQSSEFQFIAFDELTQFQEFQYRYLHSRLRRLADSNIPIRMRVASNPGGEGHSWVYDRFINADTRSAVFIPARLDDNPYLDKDEYIKALNRLDPITREQLLNGDWEIRPEGMMFKRHWFKIVDAVPGNVRKVRYWDMAATEGGGDYLAGCLFGEKDGICYIMDMKRVQLSSFHAERLMEQTAAMDGREVMIRWEEEGGSAGKYVSDHFIRELFFGYNAKGIRSTGSKIQRAAPVASKAEAGNIYLLRGHWNEAFLDELTLFPQGGNDDQVDATSGALEAISTNRIGAKPPRSQAVGHNPLQRPR